MNIDDLKKDLEKGNRNYNGLCHDCGRVINTIEVNDK